MRRRENLESNSYKNIRDINLTPIVAFATIRIVQFVLKKNHFGPHSNLILCEASISKMLLSTDIYTFIQK